MRELVQFPFTFDSCFIYNGNSSDQLPIFFLLCVVNPSFRVNGIKFYCWENVMEDKGIIWSHKMKSICEIRSLLCVLNTKMSPYYNMIYNLAHWEEKSITWLHSCWSSGFFQWIPVVLNGIFVMNNCCSSISEGNITKPPSIRVSQILLFSSKPPPKNKPHSVKIHK